MNFKELKIILKRLYKEYVKKHLKKIFLALFLSIIVAASTSGIAWLLDPAVKKIFVEQNTNDSRGTLYRPPPALEKQVWRGERVRALSLGLQATVSAARCRALDCL